MRISSTKDLLKLLGFVKSEDFLTAFDTGVRELKMRFPVMYSMIAGKSVPSKILPSLKIISLEVFARPPISNDVFRLIFLLKYFTIASLTRGWDCNKVSIC